MFGRATIRLGIGPRSSLEFVMRVFGPPTKGIWWSLSLYKIWSESIHSSFDNMQVLIFWLGLKTPSHTPEIGVWPNFIAVSQTVYEKSVTNFLHPLLFWRPRRTHWPKFTSPGGDVEQGPLYQATKVRPFPTTPVPDICCQSSSISLTA